METYKEMIALESKKAKVLEKIRAEVLNGNNIIGNVMVKLKQHGHLKN